jgi:rhamnose utilization protein RhaD (predicted bifunctional aldolase and dehydrogenase)
LKSSSEFCLSDDEEAAMREHTAVASHAELQPLLELTQRVGRDPLLTQASTGNSSAKLDGALWIKASGKWMGDALQDDILIPLDLAQVAECLRRGVDPGERYPSASLETAMHASLPHRVVLHVHCVNTIAWAVRNDGPWQLQRRLEGLRWQWIPYVASGMPLAREIRQAVAADPDKNIFVLGNHGLVIGGEDVNTVDDVLMEVKRRLAIAPRQAHPADYAALIEISSDSPWDLPDDDEVHALGTDTISRAILAGGLLYPCQAIFSEVRTPQVFRSIPCPDPEDHWQDRYSGWPFLIIEGRGVVVSRSMRHAELAMLSGLAQVVQRLSAFAPLRYLTADEVEGISSQAVYRYRELANQGGGAR